MKDQKRCATCEWFVPHPKQADTAAGKCEGDIPQVLYSPMPMTNLAGETYLDVRILGSAVPQVLPTGRCRHHKAVDHASIIRQ